MREDDRHPDPEVPVDVAAAAAERAEARAARDWARADALKARIEAAGWRVVDSGRRYRLHPAAPEDVVLDAETRYGSSTSVPSVLEEAPTAPATVIVVVEDDARGSATMLDALATHLPAGTETVVVANDPSPAVAEALTAFAAAAAGPGRAVVRSSARLGRATALNAGLRRAHGAVVILADGSLVPAGDAVTPAVTALDDPSVAVVGAIGLAGRDLAHLGPSAVAAPDAIGAAWLAFRRVDVVRLGPLDERFIAPEHLDAWWSLALRAGNGDAAPRRAVRVDLPLSPAGHGPDGPGGTGRAGGPARARLARRNLYRLLDAFRDRPDLLADGAATDR